MFPTRKERHHKWNWWLQEGRGAGEQGGIAILPSRATGLESTNGYTGMHSKIVDVQPDGITFVALVSDLHFTGWNYTN